MAKRNFANNLWHNTMINPLAWLDSSTYSYWDSNEKATLGRTQARLIPALVGGYFGGASGAMKGYELGATLGDELFPYGTVTEKQKSLAPEDSMAFFKSEELGGREAVEYTKSPYEDIYTKLIGYSDTVNAAGQTVMSFSDSIGDLFNKGQKTDMLDDRGLTSEQGEAYIGDIANGVNDSPSLQAKMYLARMAGSPTSQWPALRSELQTEAAKQIEGINDDEFMYHDFDPAKAYKNKTIESLTNASLKYL